ncbi:unnamed protein product [Ixodes persulcatus]
MLAMPTAAPDSRCEEDNAGHRASPAPQPEREIGRAPEVFPGSEVPSTTGEGVREKRKRSRSKSGQSAADSGVVCDEPARTRDSQSSEESATSDYSSGSSSCAEQSDAMLLSAQHRTDRAPLLLRQGALQQALLLKRARRCARQEHRRTLELQYALLSDADGDRSVSIVRAFIDTTSLHALVMRANIGICAHNQLPKNPWHWPRLIDVPSVRRQSYACAKHLLRSRHNSVCRDAPQFPSFFCLRSTLQLKISSRISPGYSPLHLAVLLDKPEVVSLLVKANCDLNVPDGRSGRTPLYHAIALQQEHLVKQLVAQGASTEATDYAGHSCLALAKEAKSPCLPLLQGKVAPLPLCS